MTSLLQADRQTDTQTDMQGHSINDLDYFNGIIQSLSPVLALYDPFGVDVPLNCDTTTT